MHMPDVMVGAQQTHGVTHAQDTQGGMRPEMVEHVVTFAQATHWGWGAYAQWAHVATHAQATQGGWRTANTLG